MSDDVHILQAQVATLCESLADAEKERDRLRLALSGKTGYDQVEVERERLRKVARAMITRYPNIIDGDRGVNERNAVRRAEWEWLLEDVLSSPVSGGTNDKEI